MLDSYIVDYELIQCFMSHLCCSLQFSGFLFSGRKHENHPGEIGVVCTHLGSRADGKASMD